MKILDDIIDQKTGQYINPFFMMHPDNVIGYNKKRYKGYLVKYRKMIDKEVVLFGDINDA